MNIAFATLCVSAAAAAQPAAPGYSLFPYSQNLLNAVNLSFGADGRLFTGHEDNGTPTVPWVVEAGGGPPALYGDTPLLDPDVVSVDDVGTISGVAGSVLVGGGCQVNPNMGCIWAIAPDQTTSVLIGPTDEFVNVNDMLVDASGRLLFIDGTTTRVYAATGPQAFSTLFTISSVVRDLAVDADGSIYVLGLDGVIRRHASDGTELEANVGQVTAPADVVVGAGGDFGSSLYALERVSGELKAIEGGVATVIGTGFNAPARLTFGPDEALYITHRPSAQQAATTVFRMLVCPPDVNSDGALNILDFVAFQAAWQQQTPAGDCDGNGTFNILDFVCFQNIFQAGC